MKNAYRYNKPPEYLDLVQGTKLAPECFSPIMENLVKNGPATRFRGGQIEYFESKESGQMLLKVTFDEGKIEWRSVSETCPF